MSSRLRLAGIRSISLPVDISNYVMLELGQPTHCYDLDTLSGDIVVRRAAAGEKITTLDAKARPLDAEALRAFATGKLAHYKIPRYGDVRESFPMTVSGKIRKVDMRQEAVSRLGL